MMSQGFDNGTSKNEHETNHVILGQRQINKHCNETKLCFNGLKFLSIGKVKNCFKLNWKRINISESRFCEQTFVIASCFKQDFIFPISEITLNDFETNGRLQYLKKILVFFKTYKKEIFICQQKYHILKFKYDFNLIWYYGVDRRI